MTESVSSFLRQPKLQINAIIFQYWFFSPYNAIRSAASKFLSTPPTSMTSEQMFGRAGQMYDERRHC